MIFELTLNVPFEARGRPGSASFRTARAPHAAKQARCTVGAAMLNWRGKMPAGPPPSGRQENWRGETDLSTVVAALST